MRESKRAVQSTPSTYSLEDSWAQRGFTAAITEAALVSTSRVDLRCMNFIPKTLRERLGFSLVAMVALNSEYVQNQHASKHVIENGHFDWWKGEKRTNPQKSVGVLKNTVGETLEESK